MSNGHSWFKLKHSWLTDPEIRALPWRDQLRWIQLLTLFSEHQWQGVWVLKHGVSDLPVWWKRGLSEAEVTRLIRALPGVAVSDGPTGPPSLTVLFTNFKRHQESSADRTKQWRSRTDPVTPSRRDHPTASVRDGEEKKRLEKNPPTPRVLRPNDDCGHTRADPTYLTCSDRHFAERRAWLIAQNPPQQGTG